MGAVAQQHVSSNIYSVELLPDRYKITPDGDGFERVYREFIGAAFRRDYGFRSKWSEDKKHLILRSDADMPDALRDMLETVAEVEDL